MEQGFMKANSSNLPRIDLLMLGEFLASNKDFCSSEFRNVKTSVSARPSYSDDAISYVQLKREGKMCIVKWKICPEHKVHSKLYAVTLTVDEEQETVNSVECHDCVPCQGGCKHAIAFLMWVHRRSEEPSCTSVTGYWMESKLSKVGTSLKYMTAKDLSNSRPSLPSNNEVLKKFVEVGKKRKINNCELLRYQPNHVWDVTKGISMHQLVLKHKENSCDTILGKLILADVDIIEVEEETKEQYQNNIWHELRYGRITASRAFEFSRCKTNDGTLISLIMGANIADTPAMKRRRTLKDKVGKTASSTLGKKIRMCWLMLSKKYPMIAGSPDGICEDAIIEIKCSMSTKSHGNYVKNGKPTSKYNAQMQIQMYLTGLKKGYFCIADCNYSTNKNVEIFNVIFDERYVQEFLKVLESLWKANVYPLLYQSTL